jgi:hypothetical protein
VDTPQTETAPLENVDDERGKLSFKGQRVPRGKKPKRENDENKEKEGERLLRAVRVWRYRREASTSVESDGKSEWPQNHVVWLPFVCHV